MTRVIERRQFIAMKTVAPARERMCHHRRHCDRDEQPEIGPSALDWMLKNDVTAHASVDSAFAYSGRAPPVFRRDPEFGVAEARVVRARNHN
jgi:2',3'-cyclic-nucleotide 2'-phosphodiesterase (5'-nucleotidase family)